TGELPSYDCDLRMRHKSGEWIWIHNTGSIVSRTDDGKPLMMFGTHTDITQRKRSEERLSESEHRYRLLIESVNEAIVVAQGGMLKFVNPATMILLGRSEDELIQAPFAELIHADDRAMVIDRYQRRSRGEDVLNHYVFRMIRNDGTIRWVKINAVVIDWEGQPATLNFLTDITERISAEDLLRQVNKKLNLLASITRHDINNQLTVLSGFLSLAEKESRADKTKGNLTKAKAVADRISGMIQFTKEYEDIGVLSPIWHKLRDLVTTASGGVVFDRVRLINDVDEDVEIFADPLIIKVFHNLMSNAVRHGGALTYVHFRLEGDSIVCEDDGSGIDSDFKENLFTPGFGKDHGYGLFLSREILSITGILINESGEPAKGARFVMTPPVGGLRRTSAE
ncbi:MAG TPA: PAS domain S-box protein, partial [Methanomassiliicoccales archaeon]|nr:PAS domain S-box protein [Methanomassiliicoccales archaeon]